MNFWLGTESKKSYVKAKKRFSFSFSDSDQGNLWLGWSVLWFKGIIEGHPDPSP